MVEFVQKTTNNANRTAILNFRCFQLKEFPQEPLNYMPPASRYAKYQGNEATPIGERMTNRNNYRASVVPNGSRKITGD